MSHGALDRRVFIDNNSARIISLIESGDDVGPVNSVHVRINTLRHASVFKDSLM